MMCQMDEQHPTWEELLEKHTPYCPRWFSSLFGYWPECNYDAAMKEFREIRERRVVNRLRIVEFEEGLL